MPLRTPKILNPSFYKYGVTQMNVYWKMFEKIQNPNGVCAATVLTDSVLCQMIWESCHQIRCYGTFIPAMAAGCVTHKP